MATKQNISTIVFFSTLIALQSMNLTAQLHSCLEIYSPYRPWADGGHSCEGALMRWRYSPTDDVRGDCIDWCKTFDASIGISCAQMNEDEDHKISCLNLAPFW
ncbi:hypothetical protein MKW94_015041, partial [Papaver nudicaule]|nr:hypothetical protein [Papaver nudicaule]